LERSTHFVNNIVFLIISFREKKTPAQQFILPLQQFIFSQLFFNFLPFQSNRVKFSSFLFNWHRFLWEGICCFYNCNNSLCRDFFCVGVYNINIVSKVSNESQYLNNFNLPVNTFSTLYTASPLSPLALYSWKLLTYSPSGNKLQLIWSNVGKSFKNLEIY